MLAHVLIDQRIVLLNIKTDVYGRKLGRPHLHDAAGEDVVAYMMERGYCWWDCKHSKDLELAKLQENAKKMKFGLWFSDHPIPPWNWRLLVRMRQCQSPLQ